MYDLQLKFYKKIKKDILNYYYFAALNYKKFTLEQAREKVRSKNKLKVIFYVTEKAKWSADSLFRALKKYENIEVNIAVPYFEDQTKYSQTIEFFSKIDKDIIKLNTTYGKPQSLLDFEPDIVFYQQPWEIDESNLCEKISKSCLCAYIPYGFMSIDSDYAHYYLPFHFCLWRYFAESEEQKKLLARKNRLLAKSTCNLGYPKLDIYKEKTPTAKSHKTIIYAPHWSIEGSHIHYSTFDKNCWYFLEKAKSTPDIEWIFKPHPVLVQSVINQGFMTYKEYADYVKQWEQLPNAKVVTDGNYLEEFLNSDALITDSISFLAEYLPSKKPIIHLQTGKTSGFNIIAKKMMKDYYKVKSTQEIDKIFDRVVIKGDDYLYKKRMKALKYVIDNKTPAGENIAEYLLKTFDLNNKFDNKIKE